MKRIAQTLLVLSLATAATGALAAQPSSPYGADETTSLSSEFPNMRTYADSHRDSAANQPSVPGPSSAAQEYPLSSDFPSIVTYKQGHRNDSARASNTPTFPYSVPNEESMADEGLVPGIAGTDSADGAVGATR